MMIPAEWLTQAAERIAPYIHTTPLTHDTENDVYLKWESYQVTGSFKARGALNKILSLNDWERRSGLVTASAGNHGQGVALAGRLVGSPVIVFASEHATPSKIEAMQAYGADVRLVPGGYGEAEQAGLQYAAQSGAVWVSPYNDGQVIAGQGTLGLEILSQLKIYKDPRPTTWIVPAGGGGLAAGIGAAIHMKKTSGGGLAARIGAAINKKKPVGARLVAVSSEASPFLYALYHTGSQAGITELPSLADGLAGPVEPGSVTIPLARAYIDDFILVSEEEIRHAIAYAFYHYCASAWQQYIEKIEGSAATALAAVLSGKISARPAIVVLTGGNIQPEVHARIIQSELPTHHSR